MIGMYIPPFAATTCERRCLQRRLHGLPSVSARQSQETQPWRVSLLLAKERRGRGVAIVAAVLDSKRTCGAGKCRLTIEVGDNRQQTGILRRW